MNKKEEYKLILKFNEYEIQMRITEEFLEMAGKDNMYYLLQRMFENIKSIRAERP